MTYNGVDVNGAQLPLMSMTAPRVNCFAISPEMKSDTWRHAYEAVAEARAPTAKRSTHTVTFVIVGSDISMIVHPYRAFLLLAASSTPARCFKPCRLARSAGVAPELSAVLGFAPAANSSCTTSTLP